MTDLFAFNNRSDVGTWKTVCATGWNDTWSNLACNQLGHLAENETAYREISEKPEAGLFNLNSTILPETILSVQAASSNLDEDNCDMAVDLKCHEFGQYLIISLIIWTVLIHSVNFMNQPMIPFFKKMGHPRPLFRLFSSFQTNITFLTTNICEKMLWPSSKWRRYSNPRPLEHNSPPITTRPGLLPYV